MRAVDSRHTDLVKYLTKCGADIAVKDKLGRSALDIARNKNYFELTGLLE